MNIAFIGRKQNSKKTGQKRFKKPWAIDRARLKEEQGLAESGLTTSKIKDAKLIFTRLNPERTNKRDLHRVAKCEQQANPQTIILNSSQHFSNYANKAQCFSLWQEAGLTTPAFQLWSPWLKKSEQIKRISALLKQHNGLYIRTSNEDSGKGIFYIPKQASNQDIHQTIFKLRLRALTNKVSASKILAVEPIQNKDDDNISHVYRAHIVCGHIIGGYALVGKGKVIHSRDQTPENFSAFLKYNARLKTLLQQAKYQHQLLKAMHALKADIGAVEFFEVKGELVFLEMNPLWGGKHRFGSAEFMNRVTANLALPALSQVAQWLNAKEFYRQMYKTMGAYISEANDHVN